MVDALAGRWKKGSDGQPGRAGVAGVASQPAERCILRTLRAASRLWRKRLPELSASTHDAFRAERRGHGARRWHAEMTRSSEAQTRRTNATHEHDTRNKPLQSRTIARGLFMPKRERAGV
jgi:hypothetical protein